MARLNLRDDQWERIAPLAGKRGDRGRSGADNRLFFEALLWIAPAGALKKEGAQAVIPPGVNRTQMRAFDRHI